MGGAGTYSKVPGSNTRQAANNIVGSTPNNKPGTNNSKPPAIGARAGPNVRPRANGAMARGSSRGGEDADQIMSNGGAKGQRSGSAARRAGASAAAYQAQSVGMGVDQIRGGGAHSKGARNSSNRAVQQDNVFEYTDSLMEQLGTPEMLI